MRLTWIVSIQGRRQTGIFIIPDFIVYYTRGSEFISRRNVKDFKKEERKKKAKYLLGVHEKIGKCFRGGCVDFIDISKKLGGGSAFRTPTVR